MNVLVINAGSSSLKYQLMDPATGNVTAKGLCERIGLDGRLTHKVPATGKKVEKDIPMPTHKEAIEAVMSVTVSPSARCTTPPTSWASRPVKRPCRASPRSLCSTPRSI